MPVPKCQCQPDLDTSWEKLVLMWLVNCLLTAKKLFNQSRLHNLMSELDYVTQWKFLKRCSAVECDIFPSVFWHCWLGDRKGIRPVKSWVLVCWWWWSDWSLEGLVAPVVTATFIIVSSNIIQNRNILVLASPGFPENFPGKWSLNE